MVDWDGRIAAAIVLQGCNFRCPCCHSAGFVRPGPPEREIPWEVVEGHLVSNAGWLDGAVVSGGEPTIHPTLTNLLEELKSLDLPVKLDTNGSSPARLREMVGAGLVGHVAMDVKAPLDAESYARATGLDLARAERALEAVGESLEYLRTAPVSYELRTTLSPDVFRGPDGLDALAAELSWASSWFLQGFRPVGCLDPSMEKYPTTDPALLEREALRLRDVAPGCRARGAVPVGGTRPDP